MKKIILVLCALLPILVVSANNYAQAAIDADGKEYIYMGPARVNVVDADDVSYADNPINKLGRGLINGATFWVELPTKVVSVSKEDGQFMGATIGLAQGVIASVIRAGTAIIDTATFLIPPYNQPIMKPEYAINHADEQMKDYLW